MKIIVYKSSLLRVILCVHLAPKDPQPGQLYGPAGIMVDDSDLVYVSDESDFITVYTTNGEYCFHIKKHLNNVDKRPEYKIPVFGLKVDKKGKLYVCCSLDGHLKLF